jgi:hypothetical protein
MGLDNGIVVNTKALLEPIKIPFYVKPDSIEAPDLITLCYWRKCWGLRGKILTILGEKEYEYFYPLNAENVRSIRKEIDRFMFHPKTWDHSICTWDEVKWRLLRDSMNLFWLEKSLLEDRVEAYFYDSY